MIKSGRAPRWLTMMACASALNACSDNTPSAAIDTSAASNATATAAAVAATSPYKPTATFQEIMDSVLDFSSDYIWKAVSSTTDMKGLHTMQPRTDEQWHEFRRRAILLVEAANLIVVPGRRVANGDKTVEDKQPLEVVKIQQRLDSQHDQLAGFASALREVSLKLLDATDKRDVAAITDLGGTLDEVCESCHKVFWYPDQQAAAPAK